MYNIHLMAQHIASSEYFVKLMCSYDVINFINKNLYMKMCYVYAVQTIVFTQQSIEFSTADGHSNLFWTYM